MYDFMDYLESMKDYEDALQFGFNTVEEYYEYMSVMRKQMEG